MHDHKQEVNEVGRLLLQGESTIRALDFDSRTLD